MRQGRLIVVEGPDGVGRTSLIRNLRRSLEDEGRTVTTVRLRGSAGLRGPLRDLQRRGDIAERALFLLYVADLAVLAREDIGPALAAGRIVLADRYTLTPVVRAEARGIDGAWASDVLGFLPEPDLTLVLEADARVRLARLLTRRRFLTPRESGLGATFRRDAQAMLMRYQRKLDLLFHARVDDLRVKSVDASKAGTEVLQAALETVRGAMAGPCGGGAE